MLESCPSSTVMAHKVEGKRGFKSSPSVIRRRFYLSWNPGIGPDDTSATLAEMSAGCFHNAHLHCVQRKEWKASVTLRVLPLSQQVIHPASQSLSPVSLYLLVGQPASQNH